MIKVYLYPIKLDQMKEDEFGVISDQGFLIFKGSFASCVELISFYKNRHLVISSILHLDIF